jgi:hypothetical protein
MMPTDRPSGHRPSSPSGPRTGRGVIGLSPIGAERCVRAGTTGALLAAAGLTAISLVATLPDDPDGYGLTSATIDRAQLGLAGLMAVAGLLAAGRSGPAASLMALAATGLGLLAWFQYPTILVVALPTALLIPAVLTWLAWQSGTTVGRVVSLTAVTLGLLAATTLAGRAIHGHYFGPTHPGSTAEALRLGEGDWAWLGAVTPTGATITVGGLGDRPVELRYWPADRPDRGVAVTARPDRYGLARIELTGLDPGTAYRYGTADPDRTGAGGDGDEGDGAVEAAATFRTFADGPQDLVVALASCARLASNGAVFDAIVAAEPDLYLSLGDMHYANLESTDPADHLRQYGRSLGQPGQAALYSSIPTAYVWDDHDYGPNEADSSSPSRPAVGTAYRLAVPHYGVDPDVEGPIAQAFTVGRVRFVLSDTRSQRDATTMLGPTQLDWLVDELVSSAATHRLVVWANPTPWIGAAGSGTEDWSTRPDERQAISRALVEAGVDNLVMVSGDAHMVAIDDGTNSNYSGVDGPGFPVLHGAALDRPGSVKGGPYSHGVFAGPGRFGLLEVRDDGGETIEVRLSGRTWDGEELVAHRVALGGPAVDGG